MKSSSIYIFNFYINIFDLSKIVLWVSSKVGKGHNAFLWNLLIAQGHQAEQRLKSAK